MSTSEDTIAIRISRSQALVLFEWFVTQTANQSMRAIPFEDPSEREVLWALETQLETLLTADVVAPDYNERVEVARTEIRKNSN
jgi:hypothetical protein